LCPPTAELGILGGSFGGRIHEDTALVRAFREGLDERMMGFAHETEIRQSRLPTGAVQGAILRVLSERLMAWAQQSVAAAQGLAQQKAEAQSADARTTSDPG
jgi:hypothetical protein